MNDLDGIRAIVTGGASGIGAATAALLTESGARVAILDRAHTGDSGLLELTADITDRAAVAAAVALAADHVSEGVRVNAVLPRDRGHPVDRALRARQPLGGVVAAQEVAHVIVYLAGPLSGSTTATLLTVDGALGSLPLPH